MDNNATLNKTHRRGFLEFLVGGAAALGLSALVSPVSKASSFLTPPSSPASEAESWMNKIKGSQKVVFDATQPHGIFPFAWPRVFMMTNEKTGVGPEECGVVVVLRHSAIGYAFENRLWNDYKFGELFSADDPKTEKRSLRNPFWKPEKGDFTVPGIGEVSIGINELQEMGVLFCVCDTAITVYSSIAAGKMNKEAAAVRSDWMSGLLPGIQPVPSGVWAIGRAQQKGCAYIFAG